MGEFQKSQHKYCIILINKKYSNTLIINHSIKDFRENDLFIISIIWEKRNIINRTKAEINKNLFNKLTSISHGVVAILVNKYSESVSVHVGNFVKREPCISSKINSIERKYE